MRKRSALAGFFLILALPLFGEQPKARRLPADPDRLPRLLGS